MRLISNKRFSDVLIALFLGGLAYGLASSLLTAYWSHGKFYQTWFGPAVTLACGRGFADVDFSAVEGLTEFLTMNSDHFSCSNLPAGPLPLRVHDQWTDFQRFELYLIGSLGHIWSFTGVKWQSLSILMGMLNAVFAVSAFALFRLAMGRVAAALTTLLLILSPGVNVHLLACRDFSKAPFFVLAIFGIAWMVTRGHSGKKIAMAAVLSGLSAGIGMGFREDLLIIIPMFFMAATLFLPGGPVTRAPKDWLTATGCFTVSFTAASVWLFSSFTGGSNSWHVALLGMLSEFTPFYRVVPSPFYEWIVHPSDGYIEHLANAYQILVQRSGATVGFYTPEYDRATFAIYRTIVWTTPYDFLLRMAGVFDLVCSIPFEGNASQFASLPGETVLGPLAPFRMWLDTLGYGVSGTWLVLVVCVTAIARNFRVGVFMLLAAVYLGTYPTLQNQPRHIFHLEILGLGAFGMILSHAWAALMDARLSYANGESTQFTAKGKRLATKALAAIAVMTATGWAALASAHALQQRNFKKVAQALNESGGSLLPTTDIQWENNSVIVSPFEYGDQPRPYYKAWYISVDFDLARCGADSLTGKFFYHAKKGYNTYTSAFKLAGGPKKWKVMAPVFESDISVFRGVEIPAKARACLESFHDISGLAEKAGAIPYLYLPETWRGEDFAMKSAIKTPF